MAITGEEYDSKIVEMEFDNAAFEKNIRQSMNSLDDLQDKLDGLRGGSAFEQIAAAAADMGFDKVVNGIDSIDRKMSALGIAGATVIHNLTNSFLNFGRNLWNSTIGQVSSGGMRRALNIQQAEFLMEGLKLDVKQLKEDAMFAVEDTAYGFDEAASAAAQFGVAGVKAGEEMKHALLGVSGVAAMTGRDYASIAHIFTTMASQGRVMGMQLSQMSYAGINAAEVLAKHLNTTAANVTQMVSKGKISFKEFSDAMYEAFGEHAKDANKTFTGNLSNIKAALSRIGAEFAGPLTSDFIPAMGELRNVINQIKTDMGPVITLFSTVTKVANKMAVSFFQSLKNSRAFKNIFEGLTNIFYSFLTVAVAVGQAFKEAFPQYDSITDAFRRITIYLIPTAEAFESIKERAKLLFWWLFKTVNKIVLFVKVAATIYTIFAITFGRMAKAVVDFIASHIDLNNLLNNFKIILKGIVGFIALVIQKMSEFRAAMSDTSKKSEFGKFLSSVLELFSAVFGFIQKIIPEAFKELNDFFGFLFKSSDSVKNFVDSHESLAKAFDILRGAVGKLGDALFVVAGIFRRMTDEMQLWHIAVIAAAFGIVAIIVWAVTKAKYVIEPAKNIVEAFTKIPQTINGAFSAMRNTFDKFTKVLDMTSLEIYSQLLMRFALSVGVLALSLKLLSTIPVNNMITGLAGLATIVFLLYSAMQGFYAMGKTLSEGGDGSIKGGLLDSTKAFTWLSSLLAIMTMFTAVIGVITLMAHFDPGALAQATLTLGFLVAFMMALAAIPIAIQRYEVDPSTMLSFAGSMAIISLALGMIVSAFVGLTNAAHNSPESLDSATVLLGVLAGAIIAILAVQNKINAGDGKKALAMAGSFSIMALGIVAIANTLKQIAKIGKPKSIIAAGGAIAAVIVALGGASRLMKDHDLTSAASFAILAASLVVLAGGLAILSLVDWPKVLVGAVAITLLGFALAGITKVMNSTDILDAAAFTTMALGLSAIIASMSKLKEVDETKILAVTYATAALIGVLAGISLIGTEAAGVIMALAAAMLGIGLYFVGFGAGIMFVAKGMQVWIEALNTFATISEATIPKIINNMKGLIIGLGDVANTLVAMAPIFVNAVITIGKLMGYALVGVIYILVAGMLDLIFKIAAFLNNHITEILDAFGGLFTKISDWLYDHQEELEDIGYKLGIAIGNGLVKGLVAAGVVIPTKIQQDIGKDYVLPFAVNQAAHLGKTSQNIVNGLVQPIEDDDSFPTAMGKLAVQGLGKFREVFDINSPSEVMRQMTFYILEGAKLGIEDNKDEFVDAMGEFAEESVDEADKSFKDGYTKFAQDVKNITSKPVISESSDLERQEQFTKSYLDMMGRASEAEKNLAKEREETARIYHETSNTISDSVSEDADGVAKAINDIIKYRDTMNRETVLMQEQVEKISWNSDPFSNYIDAQHEHAKELLQVEKEISDTTVEVAETTAESITDNKVTAEVAAAEAGADVGNAFNNALDVALSGGSASEVWNALFSGMSADIKSAKGGWLSGLASSLGIDEGLTVFTGKASRDWEAEGMKILGGQYAFQRAGYASIEEYVQDMESKERKATLDKWMKEFLGTDDPLGEMTEAMDGLSGGLDGLSGSMGTATKKTDELSNAIKSSLDVFSEFNDQVGTTGRNVLFNFMNQIKGVSKWAEELSALSDRGINANFLVDLADKGPEAYDKIHALYTMTDAELSLFNQMYAKKLSLQKSTAKDIRNSFVKNGAMTEKAAEEYGKKISEATASGVEAGSGAVTDSMTKTEAQAVKDAAEEAKRQKIDDAFISQWANGVTSNTSRLTMSQAFTDLGLASMDAFKQSMNFEVILDQLIVFKNGIKDQVRSALNLFDEVAYKSNEQKKAEEKSTQQMVYNMIENTKKIGRWATNVQRLSERGLSEGLVDQLRQLGPEGADTIDAFVRMSDKELKKVNSVYASSLKLDEYTSDKITSAYSKAGFATALGLKKGLNEGKDDLLFAYQETGADASEGFANGIDPNAAREAMKYLGENSLAELKTALDSHSPSKETEKIGQDTTEGYIIGIESPSRLAEAMSKLATTTLGLFTQLMGPDKFRIMGLECIDGFAMGILEGLETKTRDILNMFTLGMFGMNENLEDPDNSLRVNIIPVVDQSALDGTSSLMNEYFGNKCFDISASVNRANAANKTNNPDSDKNLIVEAIRGLREDIRNIKNVNEGYRTDIGSLRDAITSMKVTLDTGALVGQITNPLDAALGTKAMRSLRRRG